MPAIPNRTEEDDVFLSHDVEAPKGAVDHAGGGVVGEERADTRLQDADAGVPQHNLGLHGTRATRAACAP